MSLTQATALAFTFKTLKFEDKNKETHRH